MHGRLIVVNKALRVNSAAGVTINTIQPANTYRTTVYVPAGYRAPGGVGKIGNKVGKVTVFATRSDGTHVTMTGTLTAADPARYTGFANPVKKDFANCTSRSTHTGVWLATAKQTGGAASVSFPVYVDSTATADPQDAPWASYELQWCAFAAPNLHLTVDAVDLSLVRMLVNPARRGMYFWRAVYEPLASSGKSIAADRGVSVTSAVPLSPQVTAVPTRAPGSRVVTVAGKVTAAGQPLGNVRVQVFVGHQKRIRLNRANAVVRTKADGTYTATLRVSPGTHWLRAKAETSYRDITQGGGCAQKPGTPKLASNGCVDATLAPFIVLSKPVKQLA